ncbi:hypothetical protein NP233_g2655 [Leucocoprinus birnbaumii]|uniref:Uncharacterized protein n=1 Tax=Leucocoprinus birnbaumii TaxID=56174 RepID=A0AAD5VYJ3_9AGAR|nr:hypothetical protein NP233_g2655 [Leucocoprinus birnbaumii]
MSISPVLQAEFARTIGSYIIGSIASTGTLEAARTTICVYGGYRYSVEHWGDAFILLQRNWTLTTVMILTPAVELLAHLFFAHQIRCSTSRPPFSETPTCTPQNKVTTGKYRFLSYLIVFLSIVGFGLGVASYVTAFVNGTMSGSIYGLPLHIANVALTLSVVVDWTITASLVSFLLSRDNLFKLLQIAPVTQDANSHANLNLICRQFWSSHQFNGSGCDNNGMMTYYHAVSRLVTSVFLMQANVKWPSINLYQLSLFEVVGNLYANTVLASLNSRILVAEHVNRPGNLHVTSINAASTQIHGFRRPTNIPMSNSFSSHGPYNARTVGEDRAPQAAVTEALPESYVNSCSADTLDRGVDKYKHDMELTPV